jgi:hypothetical protein
MQRLIMVLGLVAAAVMLQGCGTGQAATPYIAAITSACGIAVDEKLKPSADKYNKDSQAYCDGLTTMFDTSLNLEAEQLLKKSVCTLKRTQLQDNCFLARKWKNDCVEVNSDMINQNPAVVMKVGSRVCLSRLQQSMVSRCP